MKTRKLSNSLFIILVFGLHSWSLYGQYILVPKQHIGAAATGAAIGQSFRRSMEELNKLSGSLREIDQAMEQARNEYWATGNFSGPYLLPLQYKGSKALEKTYLDLLTSKDMWYLLFDFQDYVFSNDKNRASEVKGFGDAMLRIMSLAKGQGVGRASPVDGGINEQALKAFKGWSFQVCSTWGQTAKDYPDWDAFYKAIETNVDYYRTYVQLRDESEFFYRNPFSPLKGGSPEMFHHATSVSTGLYKSFEVSKSEYDFLVSKSNKKEIDQRISDFRKAHQGEYNSEAIMDFHWKLAEASRDLFGIYLIKRKYFVSWRKANEIFQRRIKRYGKAKVDGILNALWAEKDKENSNYPTRPDILRKSSKNLRNFLNENEDCSAKQLGENTIWYEVLPI